MREYKDLDVFSDFSGRFPWQTQWFTHRRGVRQAYYDEGPRDSDLTFVCLHGAGTWSYAYRRFIARLSSTYRVIAIDHVGFGRSDKPRDQAYYSLATHITNLRFLLEELAPNNVVPIVHDWGGAIGMGWAVCNPEALAGLVLMDALAFLENPPIKHSLAFRLSMLGRCGWYRLVENNALVERSLAGRGAYQLSSAELDPYRAPTRTPNDRIGLARFVRMVPEARDPMHESWGLLSCIEHTLDRVRRVPAFLAWSATCSRHAAEVRDRWRTVFANVDGPHLFQCGGAIIQERAAEPILDRIDRWTDQVRAGRLTVTTPTLSTLHAIR